jgi:Alkylmercury lyase
MALERATDALTAAAIPLERRGRRRLRTLTEGERELYRWILRSFGAGRPPAPDALAGAASELALEVETTLERLRQRDLVHHDPSSRAILVAYPFSSRPTAHRARFNGREVYAMCAIDALGIAPMLGEPIEVLSRDPLTGDGIRVELEPEGDGDWQPHEAVVLSGTTGPGESSDSCCPVLNFFASADNAGRWLVLNSHVRGLVVPMQDAIAAGRAVFGDLLKEEE